MKKSEIAILALGAALCAALWYACGPETALRAALLIALAAALYIGARRAPRGANAAAARYCSIQSEAAASDVRFDDVAANPEALASLRELADYLRAPEKYARLGARLPRGVLLYGPPGTGKTLLARALAGEAEVPFYSLAGSDFVQMYAGVGAGRVRDLFAKARKAGKCVLFIDEIDALGKKRGEGASEEREQTLNALLSEMSGFKGGEGVMVLAATNRMDSLDPALLRPGRFDRRIEVGLPDRRERLDILRLHSKGKPLAEEVDLEKLAADTVRFSGASLESLLNEAAVRAAGRGAPEIGEEDVRSAYIKCVAGAPRPERSGAREELAAVALHEAGHAIASRALTPECRLERVSILPRGGMAGYNLTIPVERTQFSKRQLCAQLDVLLAGRAAEALIMGEDEVTAGAANDLSRAAELACAMAGELAMCESPAVAQKTVDGLLGGGGGGAAKAARALLDARYASVSALLGERASALTSLTEALLARETLTGEEVDAALEGG